MVNRNDRIAKNKVEIESLVTLTAMEGDLMFVIQKLSPLTNLSYDEVALILRVNETTSVIK